MGGVHVTTGAVHGGTVRGIGGTFRGGDVHRTRG